MLKENKEEPLVGPIPVRAGRKKSSPEIPSLNRRLQHLPIDVQRSYLVLLTDAKLLNYRGNFAESRRRIDIFKQNYPEYIEKPPAEPPT